MTDSIALQKIAQKGTEYGDCGRMCSDCAFKAGTDANAEAYTAMRAIDAIILEYPFYCHTTDLKCAWTLCIGYLYAKQLNDKDPIKFVRTLTGQE